VTEALESFSFNVAVARLYELANAITEAERTAPEAGLAWARREAVEMLVRLASPMIPHLAEEVYARLFPGSGHLVAELNWPEAEPALLAAESVTIAVQVGGRLRGTIEAAPNAPPDAVIAAAEAEANVAKALEGKRIVKRVHVPNRIVNFVVTG
jgi:leucyl-tRNA synthetase